MAHADAAPPPEAAPRAETAGRPRRPLPEQRRLGGTLQRLVIRQLAGTLLLVISIFAFAVLAAELVDYSDLVINRGFGASEVGTIALYRMLPVVARTLPF